MAITRACTPPAPSPAYNAEQSAVRLPHKLQGGLAVFQPITLPLRPVSLKRQHRALLRDRRKHLGLRRTLQGRGGTAAT